MAFLTINHLKYRYPNTEINALDDISLEIKSGEFIGLIGKNGSGKSTFCQALLGIVPNFYKGKYAGEVKVNDVVVTEVSVDDLCQTVGLVFQNPFNQLTGAKDTVYEEIAFGLENFGVEREEMRSRIDHCLNLLNIEKCKDRSPFDLSGGEMQRVAIASVLAMQPQVLILDEPTSQLDPQGCEEVFEAIRTLSSQGITVIIAEHKIEKIASYCDKIIVLNEGKLAGFDSPKKIFSTSNLEEIGISSPIYTQICKELNLKKGEHYPVTLEEAKTLFLSEGL
ncbi:MAG: ABC transporter ATP-binding protein [Eubacteriales bacterium]